MPEVPTPWIGLAALAAMVVLPLLPTWFTEGPRRIRPWPHEHGCAKCDNLAPEQIELERTRVLEGDGVTHLHYRVRH